MKKGGRAISEFVTLIWVILAGATVGFVFDFYRSFRRWRHWGMILTFIGDIIFSFIALFILYNFFLKANSLAFRFYILWGSLLGLGIYLRLFSRSLVRCYLTLYKFITYLTNLFVKFLKIPYKGLILVMRIPYALLQWFSLLLFRMGEQIFVEPVVQCTRRIDFLLNRLFPPRKED